MLTKPAIPSGHSSTARLSLRCCVNRHEPHARQANWNGMHYVSRCEFCTKPIRRISQGKWVADKKVGASLKQPALLAR